MQFSRDPLNLANVHNRKYSGFANDKAIGVNADSINTVRRIYTIQIQEEINHHVPQKSTNK